MTLPNKMSEAMTDEERARARAELARRTTEELFAATLEGDDDDDAPWQAVSVLRLRGTPEVFEVARRYCQSDNPRARSRGLSVLAQLGAGKPDAGRPFRDESVSIVIGHLKDPDPEVVESAARALSNLGTEAAVAELIRLSGHPDCEVRLAVACCIALRNRTEGISVLLALMEDEDEDVRNWATFAIGTHEFEEAGTWRYLDSPEIRAALRARLHDTFEDARREAIWGLARRKERAGLETLLQLLESDEFWMGDADAAQAVLGLKPSAAAEELREGLRRLLSDPAGS
jgi:HEAT repeat protein